MRIDSRSSTEKSDEAGDADVAAALESSWGVACLRVLGWLTALPYAVVAVLVMTGPPTWSAVAYLAGMGLLSWALVTLPAGKGTRPVFGLRRPRGLARGALVALVAVGAVRGCTGRRGETLRLSYETADGPGGPRLVARLVDEADVAVAGARVLVASGAYTDDAAELPSAMRAAYARMRREEGDAPSPVVPTYLGMQGPDGFDLVVFEPPGGRAPDAAVVFLHGFAGNFALPCWQMARAVAPHGAMTACPSTTWTGEWWKPDSERTLRRTMDTLRRRGVSRVVLAGLSNGGIAASELAPAMRDRLVGLVLLSGASPDAPSSGLPTLVVHGRHDSLVPFAVGERYATRTGAELVPLEAGHFSMLVRSKETDRAVRRFVGEVLGAAPGS